MLLLRGAAAPTVVLAALLLAGCTRDQPEPSPGPEITESPEVPATATPSETSIAAPEPPAELARTDEVGAAAAAEYFVSLYGYTMRTGDTSKWAEMSADVCGFCARILDDAEQIAANGESYSGGDITLSDVLVLPKDELVGGYPVDASFVQAAVRHTDAGGALINETSGDSGPVRIDTLNVAGSWQVLAVVVGEA